MTTSSIGMYQPVTPDKYGATNSITEDAITKHIVRHSENDDAGVEALIAHDAADAGKVGKLGAKATTSISAKTMVANDDRTNLFAGIDGVLITRPHANLEDLVNSGPISCASGAAATALAAAGASIKYYITAVSITNTGGAAGGYVMIKDGAGGTTKFEVPYSTLGAVFVPPTPIGGFSANTLVEVDPSGSDTLRVSLLGFKSKV